MWVETPLADSRTKRHDVINLECIYRILLSFWSIELKYIADAIELAHGVSENVIEPVSREYGKYILKFTMLREKI